MSDIQLFYSEEFNTLRVSYDATGNPLFVAADVCRALGLQTSSYRRVDADEKGLISIQTPGGMQQVVAVTEEGFYSLVLKSRKKQAKAFQRWVTHEVLPQIRQHGGYMVERSGETEQETLSRALLIAQQTIQRAEERNRNLLDINASLVPKAMFYDNIISSDGMLSIRDAAKVLRSYDSGITASGLLEHLREDCMIEKRTRRATAKAIERHYMREHTFQITHKNGSKTIDHYGCLTPKGLDWCRRRYCENP